MQSAEVLADGSLDLSFGNRPHHPPALFPVVEEDQQWNAVHAEVGRGPRILVDVQLAETDVAPLGRELLDHRSDHPAGSAPRRPEVNDRAAACDLIAEVIVGKRHRMPAPIRSSERCLAAPANRALAAAQLRNAVGLSATGATNNVAHAWCLCESGAIIRGVIRAAAASELPAIRDLLTRANDAPYELAKVAEEKCFGSGFEGQPQVRVYGDYDGISVTCGKYLRILAVDRARRRRGIGSALLEEAESRGARVIAAEPGNYFTPGVLEPLAPFFAARGYTETARVHNLIVEPLPESIPSEVRRDGERVLDFIEHDFGPIWRFEARRGASVFYAQDGEEIVGFCTHEANNRGLGSFGPTGVRISARGRGLGKLLALASLADLRRLGYHRAVIPWTDETEYYRKSCGARIAHRFVILRKLAD